MIKAILIAICTLVTRVGFAQTYTYIPLNLDTSCFWVSGYDFRDGSFPGYVCRGERVSAVTGDTTIGARKYSKILTYTSVRDSVNTNYECSSMQGAFTSLIHEDTVAKKVYDSYGNTIAEFNRNGGDTIWAGSNYIGRAGRIAVIDSITFQNIGGTTRKLEWATLPAPSASHSYNYVAMEGIGATRNFPIVLYGEWGIPTYWTKCYSKGGQMLYADSATSSCIRKPPLKVGVPNTQKVERAAFTVQGQSLLITDSRLLPVTVQIIDMTGRLLQSYVATMALPVALGVPSGNYVVRLIKNQEAKAFRVFID
jgi:hypothetical protein